MTNATKSTSATTHILLGLVPYTRQNLALSFHPNQFFNELERISGESSRTLRAAYVRAQQKGLINIDDTTISLSLQARQTVQPFIAELLPSGGQLMVIFDIPEDLSYLRQKLRRILKELSFKQIQQSVWMTDKDHRSIITETVGALELDAYVQLYEAVRLEN